MQTVQRLLDRAYEKIQVKSQYEELSDDLVQNGIDELNEMMWELDADGVSVGWRDVSSADENLPVADWLHGMILNGLAIQLAPDFGYTIDPRVIAAYENGLQVAYKNLVPIPTVFYPDILPTGGSRVRWNRDRFFYNTNRNSNFGQGGYARDEDNDIINSQPSDRDADRNQ